MEGRNVTAGLVPAVAVEEKKAVQSSADTKMAVDAVVSGTVATKPVAAPKALVVQQKDKDESSDGDHTSGADDAEVTEDESETDSADGVADESSEEETNTEGVDGTPSLNDISDDSESSEDQD